MSEELRPCPFCGGQALTKTFFDYDDLEYMPLDIIEPEVTCENERCINGWWLSPNDWNTRPIEDNLRKRIAELEEQVWSLNLENERMEEAYWIDESIAPDGTSKPSVRKLLERLEKAETDLRLSDDLVKALDNRIAELEAESERFTVHSDIERQDDKSPNDTQTDTVVYGKESEE